MSISITDDHALLKRIAVSNEALLEEVRASNAILSTLVQQMTAVSTALVAAATTLASLQSTLKLRDDIPAGDFAQIKSGIAQRLVGVIALHEKVLQDIAG